MLIHNQNAGDDENTSNDVADNNPLSDTFTVDEFRENFANKNREEEGDEEV